MGCSSSSVQAQMAQAKPQPEAPLTITEATPQERALMQLKLIFDSIDTDENGASSKDALTKALEEDPGLGSLIKEAGFNVKYDVLSALETHRDGCVSWQEFQGHVMEEAVAEVKDTRGLVAVVPAPPPPTHSVDASPVLKQLKAIFASIDVNENGTVSKDELAAKLRDTDEHGLKDGSLGQSVEKAGFSSGFHLFKFLHTNEEGRITWDEFEAHLRMAAPSKVKEQGDVSTVELQETDGAAPLCGCW